MAIPHIKKALITNIGRVANRVIENIRQLKPQFVYIFKQKNPGWNDKNPDYKEVLDSFRKHSTIQSLIDSNRLKWVELDSLTNYTTLFDKLADLAEDCSKRFDITYIDCTGFTKMATIVAQHLSGMHQSKIVPILNPSTAGDSYVSPRDTDFVSDQGRGPETIPFIKIDTGWISDPKSNAFAVMKAAYTIVTSAEADVNKKFNKRDLEKTLVELKTEVSPWALGKALKKLTDSGLLIRPLFLASPKDFRMTMPAFALMRRILERRRPPEGRI